MKTNAKITKRSLVLSLLILFAGSSLLNAQIKVLSNGTVQAGNTADPVFDPSQTRFEVNVPKAVVIKLCGISC